MDAPRESDSSTETFFLHELSPELEEELLRRAQENGHDAGREAADIIQRHLDENDDTLS